MSEEAGMNAEREMIALLREIRDLVQILLVREQLPDLLQHPPAERNSRSWSVSAHRSHEREDELGRKKEKN
jgi:hypothetical protein